MLAIKIKCFNKINKTHARLCVGNETLQLSLLPCYTLDLCYLVVLSTFPLLPVNLSAVYFHVPEKFESWLTVLPALLAIKKTPKLY